MDILIHTFSGIAVASTVVHFIPRTQKKNLSTLGFGALGGALPDFDAISLWSKFDGTIGSWMNLEKSGREIYFNTYPYSHHGAMHSLLFPILLVLLVLMISTMVTSFKRQGSLSIKSKWKKTKWAILTFLGAYFLHVIEDMPTPGSVWGGVNLWWPSDVWVGGSGSIWWWNNYDLFLIVCGIILLNLLLLLVRGFLRKSLSAVALLIFVVGIGLGVNQILTRGYDFDYEGFSTDYNIREEKSKEIQRGILGDRVYSWMEQLDNHIPLNF